MSTRAKLIGLAVAGLALLTAPAHVVGQGADAEAVMVAAGEWARGRLPSGALRLDPHRTGRSTDGAATRRVASALGADLGTLEQTRRCDDALDASTCRLGSAALLAIAPPAIRGDEARVRVYAWYRQDDARSPVAKASWDLTLRRTGSGWRVDGGGRLD